MTDTKTPMARRLFDSQMAYSSVHGELDDAVCRIFGLPEVIGSTSEEIRAAFSKMRVSNWSVECDSAYDNSIEIRMDEGQTITDADRSALLALGFSRIYTDERVPKSCDAPTAREAAMMRRHHFALLAFVKELAAETTGNGYWHGRARALLRSVEGESAS